METVRLGRTGLNVSVAALGCGGKSRLGRTGGASFDQSVEVVKAALDRGVTLVDTAASYGTEEIVAAAVKGRRDKVVISTKLLIHKRAPRQRARTSSMRPSSSANSRGRWRGSARITSTSSICMASWRINMTIASASSSRR